MDLQRTFAIEMKGSRHFGSDSLKVHALLICPDGRLNLIIHFPILTLLSSTCFSISLFE